MIMGIPKKLYLYFKSCKPQADTEANFTPVLTPDGQVLVQGGGAGAAPGRVGFMDHPKPNISTQKMMVGR